MLNLNIAALFLIGTHFVASTPLKRRASSGGWASGSTALYSLLSIVALAWSPPGTRHRCCPCGTPAPACATSPSC
ncbi:MAG: hypothetical protein U1E17_01625 [Geminicoccaceae bacterium]